MGSTSTGSTWHPPAGRCVSPACWSARPTLSRRVRATFRLALVEGTICERDRRVNRVDPLAAVIFTAFSAFVPGFWSLGVNAGITKAPLPEWVFHESMYLCAISRMRPATAAAGSLRCGRAVVTRLREYRRRVAVSARKYAGRDHLQRRWPRQFTCRGRGSGERRHDRLERSRMQPDQSQQRRHFDRARQRRPADQ